MRHISKSVNIPFDRYITVRFVLSHNSEVLSQTPRAEMVKANMPPFARPPDQGEPYVPHALRGTELATGV